MKDKLFKFWRKSLPIVYLLILFHGLKDILQDFLELDFLYFLDVNENLEVLPQFFRWLVVVGNVLATVGGFFLVFAIPFVWIKTKKQKPVSPILLEQISMIVFVFIFFIFVIVDTLLDPRIFTPKLFFDKQTRKPASVVKKEYSEILKHGPL